MYNIWCDTLTRADNRVEVCETDNIQARQKERRYRVRLIRDYEIVATYYTNNELDKSLNITRFLNWK